MIVLKILKYLKVEATEKNFNNFKKNIVTLSVTWKNLNSLTY